MTRRARGLLVPVVALVALLVSGTWLVTQERGFGGALTGWGGRAGTDGGWMMGGGGFGGLDGDGTTVGDLADARDRVEEFARTLGPGLGVGEVMRFENQYYAELEEQDGTLATEVLVDPETGAVQIEFGPARMWNTRFGMMGEGTGSGAGLSATQAREVAGRWLAGRDGLSVDDPDAFPGYYTVHTLRDGRVEGMLSVHAVTGEVWYHDWHGAFLEMSEAE